MEVGVPGRRKEWALGGKKKKSFSETSSLFFKTKLFLHSIILIEYFVAGVLN